MPSIRPYRDSDRDDVDEICILTGDAGRDARPVFRDPSVLPALYARPYTVLEPDLAFVADDGGRAVGYVLGAADTARFAERFRREWLPLVAERYPEPDGEPRRDSSRDELTARALHHPENMVVPDLAAYPAHLHIDLLPSHQGAGLGRALIATLLGALHERGVGAVHLGVATGNAGAVAFYERLSFHRIAVARARGALYLGRSTSDPVR